jgi:hypothetical protein
VPTSPLLWQPIAQSYPKAMAHIEASADMAQAVIGQSAPLVLLSLFRLYLSQVK